MIEILQINLRKSGPARRLMEHTVQELGVYLLILSEVPRGPPDTNRWVSSLDKKAVVALPFNAIMAPVATGSDLGFAVMLL